ncbi:hypothetical protein H6F43_20985 [Leptolyngbya sp. FACHB-36]|uniref:hypothetical protein n=1 Tax=Leptolyngbya sp. FACHB-36 TaxID=2692808 RepID=UPI00167FFF73|nr:hypothetical protein [Leptolyngbya sp. FACHB-36]MBD2022662.1 hypothetical protein [Leptolyngbya sp. FACHB-36]
MEPTETQFLVVNALQTLNLLEYDFYDVDSGDWYISTPSAVLPIAIILPNGDVVPTGWRME